jgi:hypothetical protein
MKSPGFIEKWSWKEAADPGRGLSILREGGLSENKNKQKLCFSVKYSGKR